ALQRAGAGAFGKPLIPANAKSDAATGGIPNFEAGIARREVEFFLIAAAVRNMRFPVYAELAAIGVDHHNSVIVRIAGTFENADRQYDAQFLGKRGKARDGRMAVQFMCLGEGLDVLLDAEVIAIEKLLKENEIGAL